jgi:hypothetical protein
VNRLLSIYGVGVFTPTPDGKHYGVAGYGVGVITPTPELRSIKRV